MTTKTKQILAIVLLSVICAIVLFLGIFSFIPTFGVCEYDLYISPAEMIKKSKLFTDSMTATYLVELDEETEFSSVQKILKSRFNKAYGYYGVQISYDEQTSSITVLLPNNGLPTKILSDEEMAAEGANKRVVKSNLAKSICDNIVVNGKVEILSTNYTNASYSEDSVVLTQEHFKSASVRSYINGERTLYICRVKLTKDGLQTANDKLTTSTPYTCAVDGEVNTWVYFTGSELQITYAFNDVDQSKENANVIASFINTDVLNATLTLDGSFEEISNNTAWIYLLVFGLIIIASFAFFAIRYKILGIAPMLWQACAVVVFTIFAGLVHLEIFNLAAAIGAILAYCFMTFFTYFVFERIRSAMAEGKSYSWARHTAFKDTTIISLIAHGALLVLGIILWVIPSIVTTPLGCVFVYGAVLSFLVTFCLNRLFALIVAPFYDYTEKKGGKVRK